MTNSDKRLYIINEVLVRQCHNARNGDQFIIRQTKADTSTQYTMNISHYGSTWPALQLWLIVCTLAGWLWWEKCHFFFWLLAACQWWCERSFDNNYIFEWLILGHWPVVVVTVCHPWPWDPGLRSGLKGWVTPVDIGSSSALFCTHCIYSNACTHTTQSWIIMMVPCPLLAALWTIIIIIIYCCHRN